MYQRLKVQTKLTSETQGSLQCQRDIASLTGCSASIMQIQGMQTQIEVSLSVCARDSELT